LPSLLKLEETYGCPTQKFDEGVTVCMLDESTLKYESYYSKNLDIINVHVVCPDTGNIWEKVFQQVFAPLVYLQLCDVLSSKVRIFGVSISNFLSLERIVHFYLEGVDLSSTAHIVFKVVVKEEL
jgi:hypothetical protein